MEIICSITWGLLVFAVMTITMKYYIPKLNKDFGTSESVPLTNFKLILFICVCISALCGYSAAIYAASILGMFRMTLAMGVFSCICITDLLLMIIPNLCSIILIFGAAITIICEFIVDKEQAVMWLVNGMIAAISILIVLVIVSKLSHDGLGMGDVKLFSSFGLLCGIRAVCFTLLFAFLVCAVVSTGLLIMKKKQLQDSLPLGPFIWIGYGITIILSII